MAVLCETLIWIFFEFEAADKQARCVLSNNAMQLTIEPDSSYPLLQFIHTDERKSIAIENLSGAPDNFIIKWDGFTASQ